MWFQPQVVQDLSALGLRHVGYGIPVEILGGNPEKSLLNSMLSSKLVLAAKMSQICKLWLSVLTWTIIRQLVSG